MKKRKGFIFLCFWLKDGIWKNRMVRPCFAPPISPSLYIFFQLHSFLSLSFSPPLFTLPQTTPSSLSRRPPYFPLGADSPPFSNKSNSGPTNNSFPVASTRSVALGKRERERSKSSSSLPLPPLLFFPFSPHTRLVLLLLFSFFFLPSHSVLTAESCETHPSIRSTASFVFHPKSQPRRSRAGAACCIELDGLSHRGPRLVSRPTGRRRRRRTGESCVSQTIDRLLLLLLF